MRNLALLLFGTLVAAWAGCAQPVRSTATGPLTPNQIAELWRNPEEMPARDVFWGPWGQRYAPPANGTFKFVEEKTTGFSPGMTVTDAAGVEWSVKQGAEAQTEVVVSRILSAVGYHQPPVYYVPAWRLTESPASGVQKPGRFRPKIDGMKNAGEWSWQENPFIGTRPYGGLIALLMLVNSTDLRNSNNTLYEVDPEVTRSTVTKMYVVRDLGAALGETGRIDPRRGDPFVFAKERFIRGVSDGHVRFNYRGMHGEIVEQVTTADLDWMTTLVSKLSMQQWRDAFRAGGYGPGTSEAFITRITEKLEEARRLRAS